MRSTIKKILIVDENDACRDSLGVSLKGLRGAEKGSGVFYSTGGVNNEIGQVITEGIESPKQIVDGESWNQSSLNKSFRSSPVIPAKADIHKSLSWIPARATPDYNPGLAGMNVSI
jgi:hypothetical protein